MSIQLYAGETILVYSPANLFRGIEGVGGRITLTNFRVWFEPHALNIQSHPEEIPLNIITGVGKRNTMGIIPNGMYIRTNTGKEFKFVTWNSENLISAINEQVALLKHT